MAAFIVKVILYFQQMVSSQKKIKTPDFSLAPAISDFANERVNI